jgi:hypothetical protein
MATFFNFEAAMAFFEIILFKRKIAKLAVDFKKSQALVPIGKPT